MLEKNRTSLTYKIAFDYGFRYSDPKLVKKLKELADVPIEITEDPLHAGNASYHFLDKKIMVSPELKDNPFILAHEMGHHELTKNMITNFIQEELTKFKFQFQASIILHSLAAYLVVALGKAKAALIMTALASAPNFITLLNEWLAWRKAKEKLIEAGFDITKIEEYEKEKAIALKTYLDGALGQSVAILVFTWILQLAGMGTTKLLSGDAS